MFPHAGGPVVARFFEFASDGDQPQFVAVRQVHVRQATSVTRLWGFDFRDFVVVRKRQKATDVGVDESLAHHFRHFAFRPQDVGDPKAPEDAFLVGVVGPHNDARQAQVQQVEGRQHRGFEVFANGHHRGVQVLHVLGHERFLVRGVQRDRQRHVFFQQFGAARVRVKGEDLGSPLGQGQCNLGAVTARAKHGVA